MMNAIMSQFSEWDSFYVIVGSSAGGLIGLQFVVLTLVSERPVSRMKEAGAAFATPNIVHFGAVLLISALLRVPWRTITFVAALWGVVGFSGLAYALIVGRRMRMQGAYKPVLEDWLFHCVLPVAAYTILALSSFAAFSHTRGALFGVGGAALLLLFVGIHNAWDAVSYHVFVVKGKEQGEARPGLGDRRGAE